MNESELQADYVGGDATDISGPPCAPAYRNLAPEIAGFVPNAPNSISGTPPGYPDLSAWPGDEVWDFVPVPGYSHANAAPVQVQGDGGEA